MRRLYRNVVVALIGGIGLMTLGLAEAHKYAAPSTSTIRYREETGAFRGRIASPREACEKDRRVKLVKQTEDGPQVVGRDRSNRRGRWRIEESNANGVYQAVIVRRLERSEEHVHDCARGTSGNITVDP